MAIIYVKSDVSGVGTGTSIDPYKSVDTAYAAASGGDTLMIQTPASGVYKPTGTGIVDTKGVIWRPWVESTIVVDASLFTGTYVFRFDHANSDVEDFRVHSVPAGKTGLRLQGNIKNIDRFIIEDSAGDGMIVTAGVIALTIKRVTTRRCNVGKFYTGLIATAVVNLEACRSYDNILYDRININAAAVINDYNCFMAGSHNYPYWIQAGILNIYNPIILGGGQILSANDTILNTAGTVTINNGVVTKGIFDGAPFSKGFNGTFTLNNVYGDTITHGHLFDTPRRGGSVCFKRDDLEAYIAGSTTPLENRQWLDALESRGLVGSYSISTLEGDGSLPISTAGWDEIREVVARGHELGTEGSTGAHLGNIDQIQIQYTGVATVCRLVISGINLKTYEDGVLDLDITFPASLYNTGTLANIINVDANYTATTSGITTDGGLMNAKVLADIDIADVKAAAYIIQLDTARAAQYELEDCKQKILSETGFDPRFHIYSSGSFGQWAADYMATNGWVGGRVGMLLDPRTGIAPKPFTDDQDLFRTFGLLGENAFDFTDQVSCTKSVHAWCDWAEYHGAAMTIYGHGFTDATPVTLQQWGWIFDACQSHTITIHAGLVAQYEWMKTQSPTTANDDAWVDKLAANSPRLGMGISSWGGKRNPVSTDGEPFSNIDTDIGSVQSAFGKFHPKNL